MLLILGGTLVAALAAFILYVKMTIGMCHSKKDMTGRVVLVTGANSGIGLETARDMVRRNAKVILACRSVRNGEEAAADILRSTGKNPGTVVVRQLDLCSFPNVRQFAQDILSSETRLDVLINNAGVMYRSKKELTQEGIDTIMAANHYGHFLLTNLLLPLIKTSSPSRIVVVSSDLHRLGTIDFSDLKGEKAIGDIQIYNNTKLANILFALELSQRLTGTGVTVNSLHPGVVATAIARDLHPILACVNRLFQALAAKTPAQGAQTSIHCAVSEELEGVTGKYFTDCKIVDVKSAAKDIVTARKLWGASLEVTGFKE